MSDETIETSKKNSKDHEKPEGKQTEHTLTLGDGTVFPYTATADWILLRKKEKPVAEMFHVSYISKESADVDRPLTFVFNGGPGAASAFLHVGALGPRRVVFEADGTPPGPPSRLVDNAESWLSFTDLVFIDPIGTGFSRAIDDSESSGTAKDSGSKEKEPEKEFWQLNRDLDSLAEFVQKYLSVHNRWTSPVFIAGESYGGFRVAKLARKLQAGYGVGLNGAILISPALEWYFLTSSDYDVIGWAGAFPTMAAAAAHHGRSRVFDSETPLSEILSEAERFVGDELIPYLAQGEGMATERRQKTLTRMADLLGLEVGELERREGRMDILSFARLLLRDQNRVCGLYDATVTAPDPFPDRANFEGPDPTLYSIERLFAGAINAQIRSDLELKTDRDYHLLNMEVNQSWKVDGKRHAFDTQIGSTDDLRYAMALNPHMKVFLTHGYYDLVTPYFASNRICNLLKLDPELRKNLFLRHFEGGHMFYSWESTRFEFRDAMRDFYEIAVG